MHSADIGVGRLITHKDTLIMKIVIFGATGTLGRAAAQALRHHTLIAVGKQRGDLQADITSEDSVRAAFERIGTVDAIIATTGNVHFGALKDMTTEQFNVGLQDKFLGQVRVALIGQHFLNEGGSITLTSGITADEPIAQGANATGANRGLEGFVIAAATELPGRRINIVSPTVVDESLATYGEFFPGFESIPAARAGLAYRRSVEGVQTGQMFKVW